MVALDPTRATPLSRGHNKGLNFRNVAIKSKTAGDRDHGGGGSMGRKLDCWRCGGKHMKRDCPKRAKEK